MPPFAHLDPDEVNSLLAYLEALAKVPGASNPMEVNDSAVRAGVDLVKGTCNICHPATGPGPSHMMMYMRGVIPSLAGLVQQEAPEDIVRKVRQGYTTMPMMARMARMPVFGYLTEQEVLAAVLYLRELPPAP